MSPVFKLSHLNQYQLVTKPGTYFVSAACNITDEKSLWMDGPMRYVIPLRALTSESLESLLTLFREENLTEVPFNIVSPFFLKGALFCNDGELVDKIDLPIRGEKMLATFDYVVTGDSEEERLLCTSISLCPREELEYVDVALLDQFKLALETLITKSII